MISIIILILLLLGFILDNGNVLELDESKSIYQYTKEICISLCIVFIN